MTACARFRCRPSLRHSSSAVPPGSGSLSSMPSGPGPIHLARISALCPNYDVDPRLENAFRGNRRKNVLDRSPRKDGPAARTLHPAHALTDNYLSRAPHDPRQHRWLAPLYLVWGCLKTHEREGINGRVGENRGLRSWGGRAIASGFSARDHLIQHAYFWVGVSAQILDGQKSCLA